MTFRLSGYASNIPFVLCTLVLFSVSLAVRLYRRRSGRGSFPVADPATDGSHTESLMKARRMYPDRPFILPTPIPQLVLPNSMVDEIKDLPSDQLSFRKAVYKALHGKYTLIGIPHPQLTAAIKIDLTRSISKTLAELQDEATYSVNKEIGECIEWTGIKIHEKLLRIVANISARIFVGLPLCRDEDWLQATINYTGDVIHGQQAISKYHPLLRPFVAPFNKQLRELVRTRNRAGKMLAPTVEAMKLASARGKEKGPGFSDLENGFHEGQYNAIAWILDKYREDEKPDPEQVGQNQLLLAFAAIHTTTTTALQAIFDLVTYPQHVPELLAEIEQVSATEPDGKLRKTSMPRLRKLDSFIKESQRMHPLGMLSLPRIVTAPGGLTLSDGTYLPLGTSIAFAHPQQTSAIPDPPPSIPNPEAPSSSPTPPQPSFDTFSPFRHSALRSLPGHENKHQFVTTSPQSISFGHGPDACPGRFFASNEIKIVVIELLRTFEMSLFGAKPPGMLERELERPKTLEIAQSYVPDPEAVVFFRRRGGRAGV